MTDRARVTYTGTSRVILPGAGGPFPVDEVGPDDTVELEATVAAGLVERGDFTYAPDADLVLTSDAYGTPSAPEPVPLDTRRDAVTTALDAVDGDLDRLRGKALDDALRGAYGPDTNVSGSLADRQARLAAATPTTDGDA